VRSVPFIAFGAKNAPKAVSYIFFFADLISAMRFYTLDDQNTLGRSFPGPLPRFLIRMPNNTSDVV